MNVMRSHLRRIRTLAHGATVTALAIGLLSGLPLRSPDAAAATAMRTVHGYAAAAHRTAGTHGRTAREAQLAAAVVRTLNVERRAHGLAALALSKQLTVAARRHNVTMVRFGLVSHRCPKEQSFTARLHNAGYKWTWAGENIAWNSRMTTAGVLQLQQLMYAEPARGGHRANILNRHYAQVGVDVYLDAAHHKVWLTTDFGRR